MNTYTCQELKLGDRVRYTGEDACDGTVSDIVGHMLEITWDDKQQVLICTTSDDKGLNDFLAYVKRI